MRGDILATARVLVGIPYTHGPADLVFRSLPIHEEYDPPTHCILPLRAPVFPLQSVPYIGKRVEWAFDLSVRSSEQTMNR